MTKQEIYERWKQRKQEKLDIENIILNTREYKKNTLKNRIKKSHSQIVTKRDKKNVYKATVALYNLELDRLEEVNTKQQKLQ